LRVSSRRRKETRRGKKRTKEPKKLNLDSTREKKNPKTKKMKNLDSRSRSSSRSPRRGPRLRGGSPPGTLRWPGSKAPRPRPGCCCSRGEEGGCFSMAAPRSHSEEELLPTARLPPSRPRRPSPPPRAGRRGPRRSSRPSPSSGRGAGCRPCRSTFGPPRR